MIRGRTSIVPLEQLATCTACKGWGFIQEACWRIRCHVCKGRGFFYVTKGPSRPVKPERTVNGSRFLARILLGALVLVLFVGCDSPMRVPAGLDAASVFVDASGLTARDVGAAVDLCAGGVP
jgi:hypothetical protein